MTYSINVKLLDKIREEQGLSSDEKLARFLNLSLGTIHGLRAGRQPSFATAIRLMDAANVSDIRAAVTKSNIAPGKEAA